MNKQAIFETVKCNFCNSKDHTLLFTAKDHYNNIDGEFSVVKCNNCALVFTNPRPSKSSIHLYYPDTAGYFQPYTATYDDWRQKILFKIYEEYYNYAEKTNFIRKLLLFPFYIYTLKDNKISGMPKYVKNGNLLDVGCSYGNYLYKMKKLGWNVKGLELNETAANYGKKKYNLDIDIGLIENWNTDMKFDIVNMSMVLEHVFDPIGNLKKIYSLLNEKGKLIISIPNFDGFFAKLYKQYSHTLHLPMHLTHFTPTTIAQHLEKTGYKNIKIIHQKADRDFIAPLTYMQKDAYKTQWLVKLLSNKIIRKTFVRLFVNFIALIKQGSRITVYAEK